MPPTHLDLSEPEAHRKATLYTRCDRALDAWGAARKRWSLWVPGRIEVLGKHTDYAGGRSLVCALERGLCVRVASRRDAVVRVRSLDRRSTFQTPVSRLATGDDGSWTEYVAAVVRRLAVNFEDVRRGADIVLASDLPADAGMSSSSALVVAIFIALSKANDLRSDPVFRSAISSSEELAAYLGAVENGLPFRHLTSGSGVGTHGGGQDHTAILCSEPGELLRFAWDPLKREAHLPMPAGHVFALGASGVGAPKTGAALRRYNRVSLAARRVLDLWNEDTQRSDSSLGAVIGGVSGAAEHLRSLVRRSRGGRFSRTFLEGRLEQFIAETFEIIPAASDALARGALAEFGMAVDHSQHLAEAHLGNQVAETVTLQRLARDLGAVAASAFGAGFGGSVWAMVPKAEGKRFLRLWKAGYGRRHVRSARDARFFLSRPGPHAFQFQH
ncbi:MAG TPA: galactokinase family protein [Gemmatimonadaceae bacterium]